MFQFPLRGEWRAMRSRGHPRYAYDFAAGGGSDQRLFAKRLVPLFTGGASVTDAYGWSAPVYASADGEVVGASDGWSDRERIFPVQDAFQVLLTSLFRSRSKDPDIRSLARKYAFYESATPMCFWRTFSAAPSR
jgi:hypothetical protein